MADAARKEKLAAAKKKLKQFQKTGRTPSSSPSPQSRNKDPDLNEKSSIHGNNNHDDDSASFNLKQKVQEKSTKQSQPITRMESSTFKARDMSSQQNPLTKPSTTESPSPMRHTQSTERLLQVQNQINGLLSETSTYINNGDASSASNGIGDLEERNTHLASLLEKHTQANEQLNHQLTDLKNQNSKLRQNFDSEKKGFEDRLKRELGALKEQLQVHIQTIGILVAEKTELQSALNQSTKAVEIRAEEVEELSGRLKASRKRVADLEKSFTSASSSNQKNEKSTKEFGKEVDRLKMELYKLNKANEEFQQQNSELQGKLQKKVSEVRLLEDDTIEMKGKLEMAELHVTQLKNSTEVPDSSSSQQIEELLTEKAQLLLQVEQLEVSVHRTTFERDQLTQQYQEYINQLQSQSEQLQTQMNGLIQERDQWSDRSGQLEAALHQLKLLHDSSSVNAIEAEHAQEQLTGQVESISSQLTSVQQNFETQVSDNNQLSQLVLEKEERIVELELSMQHLNESQINQEQLLDDMQSDKTALSRAMAQNKQLKKQLAELQNGFVKMSNDNMEVLTELSTEQHRCQELSMRLSQQEDELKDIREQCEQQERDLSEMRNSPARQILALSSETMEDHVRDFEKQTPLIENLQRELSSAQDNINSLTNQNSELRSHISRQMGSSDLTNDDSVSQNQFQSMSASVRQLEAERNQVLEQLQAEQALKDQVENHLKDLQNQLATQTPATLNGDVINKAQFEALQHAMKQLEGKYTSAMRDKADLVDRGEQLEHTILQLQGEADTIGEYVTLYQTQRGLLRQRQHEKDDYISHMARERQDMQEKLGQLQALLMQLLGERNMLHNYQGTESMSPHTTLSVANHVGGHIPTAKRSLGGKLDSSQLEDWPDYSSTDSDVSDVEQISASSDAKSAAPLTHHPRLSHSTPLLGASNPPVNSADMDQSTLNIPNAEGQTAQRIMNLLTEIGHSNLISRMSSIDHSFIHCNHCSGRLVQL